MNNKIEDNLLNKEKEGGKSEFDTGIIALTMILAYYEVSADPRQISRAFNTDGSKISLVQLVSAAKHYGLKARAVTTNIEKLSKLSLPAIAQDKGGNYFIVAAIRKGKVLIQRPGSAPDNITLEKLSHIWSGSLLLITRRASLISEELAFGLRWFATVVKKYKSLMGEVLVASSFLHLFALATPIFFQVVIDKVLVHQSFTTLDILMIGLLTISGFEVLLGYLRTYTLSHTTSRIDVQLGAKLFRHLLALPISYFESRPTGQTVARVRELENVREFLTSSALTVTIDLFFTIITIGVMWFFSPELTLIVIATIPFFALLSITVTPELRRRVEEQFQHGATNQSFLVEGVAGVETLKAMAVEPQMQSRWDEYLASYVRANFRTVALSAAASQAVLFISKVSTVAILWYGARLVISGDLTVGQLIAVNALAGQVSQPIIRLAQLWQDFQQFRISIQRLGDILNTKTEAKNTSQPENMPPLKGDIDFCDVTFRYRPNEPEILRNVSFTLKAGEIIGIVGRSGSGKSTITKIIQRMYVANSGRVLIDGHDIALLDPAWLRRQIGIVLQDNLLFNRTVRENIALSNPAMSMEKAIEAAMLAGAHDFILQLPMGYDTMLEERGLNLSGGQRQRIAIARALASDPRVLIFDEATAALDYESELTFQENLRHVAKGRTIIIVAHRLSTVRDAHKIIVMEKGELVEYGTPQELSNKQGIYADLISISQN